MDIPNTSTASSEVCSPLGRPICYSVSLCEDSLEDHTDTCRLIACEQEPLNDDISVLPEKESLITDPPKNYGSSDPEICVHGNQYIVCCATPEDDSVPVNVDDVHCHGSRTEGIDKKAKKKLVTASILCLLFMLGEIVGGYLANSLAIATDAAHLLTDFASFMISLFALYIATLPATKKMSFGYYRAEVVGALASVLMIWIVTGVLVSLAAQRIKTGDFEIGSKIMLITSGAGVAVNIVMGAVLHQHGHSHSGAASDSGANLNVRAAFIHVVGDFLQSVGVFVAALIIFFKPEWKIVDPICTFLFSILVLITTFAIMRDTLVVLMEGLPKGIDFNEVEATFQEIPGVMKVHNLRIWALSLNKTALSGHLAIKSGYNPRDILKEAIQRVRAKYNFFEMTLQIEDYLDEMGDCDQCQPPKD